MKLRFAIATAVLTAAAAYPADQPSVAQLYDSQLRGPESEIVSLAEAMPAGKYGFAPTNGEFKGVRTFLQQVTHIATTNYIACSGVLQQKPGVDLGEHENGPATIKSKDEAVKYLKDSFAYCHKAMNTLTAANQVEMIPSPFGQGQMVRGGAAAIPGWHSYDHYGQMVVYARMNGVVPPASR